jgi:hypothetical protein
MLKRFICSTERKFHFFDFHAQIYFTPQNKGFEIFEGPGYSVTCNEFGKFQDL